MENLLQNLLGLGGWQHAKSNKKMDYLSLTVHNRLLNRKITGLMCRIIRYKLHSDMILDVDSDTFINKITAVNTTTNIITIVIGVLFEN